MSLVTALLISCSNKSSFSSKDSPSSRLNKVQGASNAEVNKSGDELQKQINDLKLKVDQYYQEFLLFKASVDARFAVVDQKFKDQNAALAKEILRTDSLETWRDKEAKPLFESLLTSTSEINKTIKSMNEDHVALAGKLKATDDKLSLELSKQGEKLAALELALGKAKAELNDRIQKLGTDLSAEMSLQKKELLKQIARVDVEMAAFKTEVSTKYATKDELGKVQVALNTLNVSMVSMYTELKEEDKKLATGISNVQNDLSGLQGAFKAHVEEYKKSLGEQKDALQAKFFEVRSMLLASDVLNALKFKQAQSDLEAQSKEFGSKLNTVSFALNEKLSKITETVGENQSDVLVATKELRAVQLEHQKAIAGLGTQMSDVLTRLEKVEDVASKAAKLSEANSSSIGLLSKDFTTQKDAVAKRFGLVEGKVDVLEGKVDALEEDLKAFKEATAKRFEEVSTEAKNMVGNLNKDLQEQFGTVTKDLAILKSQAEAQDESISQMSMASSDYASKIKDIAQRQEHEANVAAFNKELGQKLDQSLLGLKDVVVTLSRVESEYISSLGLATGVNRGDFDAPFRSQLSVAGVCGVENPSADFARAGGVDYFSWMARKYGRDLVLGVRSGDAGLDSIFGVKSALVSKDSLAELVSLGLTKLEAHTPVPADCVAKISEFVDAAHRGGSEASKKLRSSVSSHAQLRESVMKLQSQFKSWEKTVSSLDSWMKTELAQIPGSNIDKSRAELAQMIIEKSKLVLDIEDKRSELNQIAKISFSLTANSLEDAAFRASMSKQLSDMQLGFAKELKGLEAKIGGLASSQVEADKDLKAKLEEQIKTVKAQVDSANKQLDLLAQSAPENLEETKTQLRAEMDKGLLNLNKKIDGLASEQQIFAKETGKKFASIDQALQSVFSVLATMAARSGDLDLLSVINAAAVNYSGSIPQVIQSYRPEVSAVQHYFTGGFSKGREDVCLSLNPQTITRSPFDWRCNVNFRSISDVQKVGTAEKAVIRVHGQFSLLDIKAFRSSVWSWDLVQDQLIQTYSKEYCTAGSSGSFCQSSPKLIRVAGVDSPAGLGGRGVFDLPDSGAMMKSIVDGNKQHFNGVLKIRGGRAYTDGQAVPTGHVVETKGGAGGEKFLMTPNVDYIIGLYSPIVLEFSESLRTLSPSEANVKFDLNANGRPEQTGWINGKTTAFLALPNAQGAIENGQQLFGQATPIKGTDRTASNGYEALAQYDADGSGMIDAKDPIFKKLVVWFDRNQDGVAQKSEMEKLSTAGVTKLAVRYSNVPSHLALQGEGLLDSNRIPFTAQFWGPENCGSKGCSSYDVFFGASEISNARK